MQYTGPEIQKTSGCPAWFREYRTSCEERHRNTRQIIDTLSSFYQQLDVWPYFPPPCISVSPMTWQYSSLPYWPPSNGKIKRVSGCFLKKVQAYRNKRHYLSSLMTCQGVPSPICPWEIYWVFIMFPGWLGTGADIKSKSTVIISQRFSWKKIIVQCENYYTRNKYKVSELQKDNIKRFAIAVLKPM